MKHRSKIQHFRPPGLSWKYLANLGRKCMDGVDQREVLMSSLEFHHWQLLRVLIRLPWKQEVFCHFSNHQEVVCKNRLGMVINMIYTKHGVRGRPTSSKSCDECLLNWNIGVWYAYRCHGVPRRSLCSGSWCPWKVLSLWVKVFLEGHHFLGITQWVLVSPEGPRTVDHGVPRRSSCCGSWCPLKVIMFQVSHGGSSCP
ncbi:uncharacterized protein [Macrobrachium rosenbergii]|uniref:uncharacterized protein n=1 Tax=Macrobrachium rosenbergii TaxID=79674 RepID=UPI0034D690D0